MDDESFHKGLNTRPGWFSQNNKKDTQTFFSKNNTDDGRGEILSSLPKLFLWSLYPNSFCSMPIFHLLFQSYSILRVSGTYFRNTQTFCSRWYIWSSTVNHLNDCENTFESKMGQASLMILYQAHNSCMQTKSNFQQMNNCLIYLSFPFIHMQFWNHNGHIILPMPCHTYENYTFRSNAIILQSYQYKW